MISRRNARYSVPHAHADTRVWVPEHAGEVIVTAVDADGPGEICRHALVPAGQISIIEAHYPLRRDLLSTLSRPTDTANGRIETHSLQPGTSAWERFGR